MYLLPSIFAVTIPMAFLLGVLLAFGRLASDSEIVALRASGVSPSPPAAAGARRCRPSPPASPSTSMAVALPAANQAYREHVFALIVSKARAGVKPRVFSDDDLVPGMVLYVSDIPAETGEWQDVFIHDVRDPEKPKVILARTGHLRVDEDAEDVSLHLEDGSIHTVNTLEPEPTTEQFQRFDGRSDFPCRPTSSFPADALARRATAR